MRRTVSSAQTFVMKYVFPVAWIGGCRLGTLGLWFEAFNDRNGSPQPSWMRWQFLVMWIAGVGFIHLWYFECCGGEQMLPNKTCSVADLFVALWVQSTRLAGWVAVLR
jgi:hypothetical protein